MTSTRREVLHTIGVTAAATALCGCGGEDSGGGVPAGTSAMCGADLCFKISENPELQLDGGIVLMTAPGKKIFVQRVSATEYTALSSVCTHAACTVAFNGSTKFNCPCHGSSFDSATGNVINGPAARPLESFETAIAGDDVTITL